MNIALPIKINSMMIRTFLVFFLGMSASFGQAHATPTLKVNFIEAKPGQTLKVSSSLQVIRAQLESSFKSKGLTNFRELGHKDFELSEGKRFKLQATSGLMITIFVEQIQGDQVTLIVSESSKKSANRVKTHLGKLFFEAIRWQGRTLILALHPVP